MSDAPEFELPNVGPGPDPCSLSALARDYDFLVLFFQRDHHCTNCRRQVKAVRDRYDAFRARDATAVSILPEPRDVAQSWQDEFDLQYPLLADPDATAGERYGQSVRFGFIGDWSDFLGRMPKIVIVDARASKPEIVWTHQGHSTWDRPSVNDVVDALDDYRD